MIILGIETSCDETACTVVQKQRSKITILSNIVASSASLQAKYGGVIPEQAAREQLKSIIPVIQEALRQAQWNCHPELVSGSGKMLKQACPGDKAGVQYDNMDIISEIDAIAITQGPGLIGSLLVGVETAKTLSLVWDKPLVPVNHLLGHFYANWIIDKYKVESIKYKGEKQKANPPILDTLYTIPEFPCLGLLVSGGHTDLILMTGHGKYKYLGGTRDDAAGECFDKCARLLGLPYPGGPIIAKLAKDGNPSKYPLPRPMIDSGDFDFSFSGLKTAVLNIVNSSELIVHSQDKTTMNNELSTKNISDLAASIQDAITDVLVEKTYTAAEEFHVNQIIVAGGVAANQILSEKLQAIKNRKNPHVQIFIPPPSLCTDNAAYIAAAAFYNLRPIDPLKLQADPSLSLSN